MAGPAQITSVEAIEAFRADLIVYLGQMRPVVDEVGSELVRMKAWLQTEQRQHWEQQARLRQRRLEEAQAELFNARLSTIQDSTILQNLAVQRTRQAVQEAETKLSRMKKWDRELENLADPLVKQVEQLQGFLSTDMARGVEVLNQILLAMEAYTRLKPSGSPTDAAPPADTNESNTPA